MIDFFFDFISQKEAEYEYNMICSNLAGGYVMWYLALSKLNTCDNTCARSVSSNKGEMQTEMKNKCALGTV